MTERSAVDLAELLKAPKPSATTRAGGELQRMVDRASGYTARKVCETMLAELDVVINNWRDLGPEFALRGLEDLANDLRVAMGKAACEPGVA